MSEDSIITKEEYVDISVLSEEAQDAYKEFVSECGVHSGERWPWKVGDEDSGLGWISKEKCDIIDKALIDVGLVYGQEINLVFEW